MYCSHEDNLDSTYENTKQKTETKTRNACLSDSIAW